MSRQKSTDQLIEELSNAGLPTRPAAAPGSVALGWLAAAAAVAISWAVLQFGWRGDPGDLEDRYQFVSITVLLAVLAASAAYQSLVYARPGWQASRVARNLPLAAALLLIGLCLRALPSSAAELKAGLASSGLACSSVLMLLAIVPGFLLFFLLKRWAPLRPISCAVAASVAFGAAGCLGLGFHCPSTNSLHLLLYHGLPILILALVGGALGGKLLRW